MKSLISLATIGYFLAGCVSFTATEPSICTTNSISLPDYNAEAGASLLSGVEETFTSSTTVDLSKTVNKLNSFGNTNVQIIENLVETNAGDFSWLKHLTIVVKNNANSNDYPPLTLVNQSFTNYDSSQVLNFNTLIDGNTLFNYLAQGEVELDFTITGTLPDTDNANMTLCLQVSDSISKSL